jgi:hypothetical protein
MDLCYKGTLNSEYFSGLDALLCTSTRVVVHLVLEVALLDATYPCLSQWYTMYSKVHA